MIDDHQRRYYMRREATARDYARMAGDPKARRAHLAMAELYAEALQEGQTVEDLIARAAASYVREEPYA
jgi:hypothetical protein